jgi:hypothetical protein
MKGEAVYLDAADTPEKRRAAERLLAWMEDQYAKAVPPEQIGDAYVTKFVKWMGGDYRFVRAAVLKRRDRNQAKIYSTLAWSRETWMSLSDLHYRSEILGKDFGVALSKLLETSSRWVEEKDGKFRLRPGDTSPSTIDTYCKWLVMLWNGMGLEHNPWRYARELIPAGELKMNSSVGAGKRFRDRTLKTLAGAVERIDPATTHGARDLWLICGAALLGLSAKELATTKRSALEGEYIIVNRRGSQRIELGFAAGAWLHRMEGMFAKTYGFDRFLAPDAPLWPSMPRWGVPDVGNMAPSTVVRILRGRGLQLTDLRKLVRKELRDAGATIKQAGVLMGTRDGEEPEGGARLAAQQAIASRVGLG